MMAPLAVAHIRASGANILATTKKRPHIFHVFPAFAFGGAELRTANIINALGYQFEHSILSLNDRWDGVERIDPGLRVRLVQPPRTRHPLRRPVALRRILVEAAPDLLITYNWGATEALMAALSLRLPTIHTEDGFGADEAQTLKRRRVLARRVLLRRVFSLVVPSDALRRIATERYHLPESKIRFIVNGVDLNRFHPEGSRHLREQFRASSRTVVFGTVARLRPEKGLDTLIRLFARADIANTKLVIVGDGPCRETLEEVARELRMSERVYFTGPTSDPAPYLRALDVFLMASRTEQTPISLLEAMACGLPVICTDVGDSRLLLGTNQHPIVIPLGEPTLYMSALKEFAESPELRKQLARMNRLRCEQHYSFSRMLQSYRNTYLEALRAS